VAFVGICLPLALFHSLFTSHSVFARLDPATTVHPLTVGIYVFPHRTRVYKHVCGCVCVYVYICVHIILYAHGYGGLRLRRWHWNQKLYNWKERRFLLRVLSEMDWIKRTKGLFYWSLSWKRHWVTSPAAGWWPSEVYCVNEINEFICYSKREGVMVGCHFGSEK